MHCKTFVVILEYCGGTRTDALYECMKNWNPGYTIAVLDNASPCNKSQYITHENPQNTYIGGGIIDCISLAEGVSCDFLLLIMNDIEPLTPIDIGHFETLIDTHGDIVQVGASVTQDSDKARPYPWMVKRQGNVYRLVPHCDLLCCILRIDFIRLFGGFPISKSGWGYDWEIACQAYRRGKGIAISDQCVVRHRQRGINEEAIVSSENEKREELRATYRDRYGDFEQVFMDMVNDIQQHRGKELIRSGDPSITCAGNDLG